MYIQRFVNLHVCNEVGQILNVSLPIVQLCPRRDLARQRASVLVGGKVCLVMVEVVRPCKIL